jgi:hypothetical protein
MLMTSKLELPKKKPNYFYILNRTERKYNEVKYLTQSELAEGWKQKFPKYGNPKLVNNFNVTLAFLPEQFWYKLKKVQSNENSYKVIANGVTRYSIIETNQDEVMINLFKELSHNRPNVSLLNNYINNLDVSQYTSWLVLRAKHYIDHGKLYN